MEQRKQNISLWCSLGLVLILLVGILILATGTGFARYRKEDKVNLEFEVRPLEHIQLGQMVQPEEEGAAAYFDPTGTGVWDTTGGECKMTFTVANGIGTDPETGEISCAKEDQQVIIRLIGSLGIWNGTDELKMYLRVPSTETETEETGTEATAETTETTETEETLPSAEPKGVAATAVRIPQDSPLYLTYGDGWVFTFLDEEGEELSWLLEGGEFSCLEMILRLEGAAAENVSMLQLQITGDYTKKSP